MKNKFAKYSIGFAIFVGLAVFSDYVLEWAKFSRRISTTGVCNTKIARDKLAVTLQIKTLDKNAAASLRAAQNDADDIARQIKKIDDASLEIQTTRISSYEKTKWEKNSSILLGIESEIDLEITTGSRDTIDAILDLSALKNAQVFLRNMRNFSSIDVIADATEKCLRVAVVDARGKAAAIAAAAGEKVGRLILARFGASSGDAADADFIGRAAVMAKQSSADYIQSADGDLSVTVSATFGIR
jgi:uncharacterized protein YggE